MAAAMTEIFKTLGEGSMKKLFAALLCSLLFLSGSNLALATQPSYEDVPDYEWYVEYVEEVTLRGWMTGVDETHFSPDSPVTRAAVITVLWRMEGKPQPTAPASFTDIDPEDPEMWYDEAAAWAREAGVASGYEDGAFRGNRPVTREELASFLFKYAQYKGQPTAEGALGLFQDADAISDWAEEAIRHVVGMGLIQGNDAGYLHPQSTAKRVELAAILVRMDTPAAG